MWEYRHTDELYHHGVKGMKWGRRKVRGHAGPAKMIGRKRQLAADKRDLEALNKGQHLSVGLTKKRQAMLDARDKVVIEKRISKNEAKIKDAERKIKASPYGQTTGQIIKKGAVTAMATYTIGQVAGKVATRRGHDYVAACLEGFSQGAALGVAANTAIAATSNSIIVKNELKKKK